MAYVLQLQQYGQDVQQLHVVLLIDEGADWHRVLGLKHVGVRAAEPSQHHSAVEYHRGIVTGASNSDQQAVDITDSEVRRACLLSTMMVVARGRPSAMRSFT